MTGRSDFRMLSLNLYAQHGDWPRRRAALRSSLHALKPDLVALQEVVTRNGYDEARDVLGPEYHIVHQERGLVGDGHHHGASIASRWPIRASHEVDLHLTPRTADYSCAAVIADVEGPPQIGRLLLVSHGNYLPWWAERERELQAVAVVRRLQELVADEPAHVVVGGDMNAEPTASSMQFWTGRRSLEGTSTAYRDCWESVHGEAPGVTLDPREPSDSL